MRGVTQKQTRAEIEEARLAAKREKARARQNAPSQKQERTLAIDAAIEAAKKRDGRQCRIITCFRSAKDGYVMIGSHLFPGRKSAFGDPVDKDGILTLCVEHDQGFESHKSNRDRIQWLWLNGFKNEARWMAARCGVDLS